MKKTVTPPAAPTARTIVKRALHDIPDTTKPAVNAAGMIFIPSTAQDVGSALEIQQLERLTQRDLIDACKARGIPTAKQKKVLIQRLWLHLTASGAPVLLTIA